MRLIHLDNGLCERRRVVGAHVGPSRSPGKIRVARWSHATKRWCAIRVYPASADLGDAPADWPATRSARAAIASGKAPR